MSEVILEPARPIIDAHHHLWDWRRLIAKTGARHPWDKVLHRTPHYLLDQLLADLDSGHDIRATVHVECGSMYRESGSTEMAPVGETEFVNGVAAMGASGNYGDRRVCAAIVGHLDLTSRSHAAILDAHVAAGGGRFRGIRQSASYDPDPDVLEPIARVTEGLYRDPHFRVGFSRLGPLGLSFDAWLLEPQLPDLVDLARAFPETRICLDHIGMPLGIGTYAGKRAERFEIWRANIESLAKCPNVFVKLGGLGMHYPAFPSFQATPPASSEELAREWRPYIDTCIQAFSPARAMFESNFPVDILTCSYATLWNSFKLLAESYSATEKDDLFFGTAARFYRLQI